MRVSACSREYAAPFGVLGSVDINEMEEVMTGKKQQIEPKEAKVQLRDVTKLKSPRDVSTGLAK